MLVESSKNCGRSRIVASPYYGMKILVAAASDQANTVCYYIEVAFRYDDTVVCVVADIEVAFRYNDPYLMILCCS